MTEIGIRLHSIQITEANTQVTKAMFERMLDMSDNQLLAQKSFATISDGSQEHGLGSNLALSIFAKEQKLVLYSDANATHVNSAMKLDSTHRYLSTDSFMGPC